MFSCSKVIVILMDEYSALFAWCLNMHLLAVIKICVQLVINIFSTYSLKVESITYNMNMVK